MNDLLHSFPGQNSNEPVYVFARSFPLSFLPNILVFLLAMVFSMAGEFLISTNSISMIPIGDFSNILILFLGIFQLIAMLVFLVSFMDFYFDVTIITDRRLVEIGQESLLYRKISELSLEDIEDVSSTVSGLFQTTFNYGHVMIQTAGEQENFSIENVRHPREIAAIALDLSAQAKSNISAQRRIPELDILGVVNNKIMHTTDDLKSMGAILPTDLRRPKRNAAI